MVGPTQSELERFKSRFDLTESGCWQWTHTLTKKGYPVFWWAGITAAHRVSFLWHNQREADSDLHHTCDNRACVNPEHLVEVSTGHFPRHRSGDPNLCTHGHEFTVENTYFTPRGERQCRECLRVASLRYTEANREKINAKKRARRPRVMHDPRPCLWCGASFVPIRSTKRYCSEHCQAMANNRKQYAKRKGIQPPP